MGATEATDTRLAIARICDIALAIVLESYKDDLLRRVERATQREQGAMRAKLDERARMMRAALRNAGVAVVCLDGAGRLALANAKACERHFPFRPGHTSTASGSSRCS